MDPFAVLGLPHQFDLGRKEIESRYRSLQRELHPDRHTKEAAPERRIALLKAMEVNEAYRIVREDVSRGEALMSHHARSRNIGSGESDPEFLMEIMELREALGDAKAGRDGDKVRVLAKSVRVSQRLTRDMVASDFSKLGAGEATDVSLMPVRHGLEKLKYYKRFLDEVEVIEDLLLDSA